MARAAWGVAVPRCPATHLCRSRLAAPRSLASKQPHTCPHLYPSTALHPPPMQVTVSFGACELRTQRCRAHLKHYVIQKDDLVKVDPLFVHIEKILEDLVS